MEIVLARPPMFDEIDAVFHVAGKPVIFTWGNTIYNPEGCTVSPALKAHESVHAQRQTNDDRQIRSWWERYLLDPQFRYAEELAAHRAEYRAFKSWTKDRNELAQRLHQIAGRLSGPLYGGVASYTEARRSIAADRG